ncbi:Threonine dehydratase, catabolic [Labilithrix luteola]|uniref:Threonine dehydratase, catabolic n=1 Tax=Labilithrix luteola TaxID=1391654 RepID=A0A0K1PXH1_9BACT|nr:pyridoxal-phosphate dependent enzyme [Labilithrix luteola]AKU97844.1 Threonine dehydratase, catabolic [Labilithrix luteola]
MTVRLPDVADVAAAASRLRPLLAPTPLVRSERFDAWLKLETLQVTRSYKVRGATNAMLVALANGDRRPIVAASAGNHARGVAWAAHRLGLEAHTVVPITAPLTKVRGAEALGAKVIRFGRSYEDAQDHAISLARENGWRFLPAFDDPDVIAGQGTVGWELLDAHPDVVLVPLGGGGLASGLGLALKSRGTRIVGVHVEGLDAMARALDGRPPLDVLPTTIADGVRVRRVGESTRRICAEVLDEIVTVTEEDVRRAVVELASFERVVAEGAGALAYAALSRKAGTRTIAVISGGNIDLDTFTTEIRDTRREAGA